MGARTKSVAVGIISRGNPLDWFIHAHTKMHVDGIRNIQPPGGLASIGDSNTPTAMGAR